MFGQSERRQGASEVRLLCDARYLQDAATGPASKL
jgi:hypothetical protein